MTNYAFRTDGFAIGRPHEKLHAVPDPSLSPEARPFLRHIERCHQARLPGGRRPLLYDGKAIGWAHPHIVDLPQVSTSPDKLPVTLSTELPLLTFGQILADLGCYQPHHELFDVRDEDGALVGQIDRGAIPVLGLYAEGVHVNGLVETTSGTALWTAKRSMSKRLDPGKLDHLVAGGISTGLTATETLIKEAEEEAGIPANIAAQAAYVSRLEYALERPEGLRRDVLHCYDLLLPDDFHPVAMDGEVESFHLMPLTTVFERVRDTDDFKFNVNLVLIDLFLRRGLFSQSDCLILGHALKGSSS